MKKCGKASGGDIIVHRSGLFKGKDPPPMDAPAEEAPEAEAKPSYDSMSFKQAFAAARKASPGENFSWKGKSFNTNLAEEAKPAVKKGPKPWSGEGAKPWSGEGQPAKKRVAGVKPWAGEKPWSGAGEKKPAPKPAAKSPAALAAAAKKVDRDRMASRVAEQQAYVKKQNEVERGRRGFAKGGSVRGDGCASRGRTKGRMC